MQWSWKAQFAGLRHQIVVGGLVESSHLQFAQSSQLGYLNPDRSVTGIASFADGKAGGSIGGEAYDTRVELNGRVRTASLYFSDTVSISITLHVTAAARYNRVQVENRDNINPGGGATSLDGHHRFSRINPSLGVAWNPSASWGVFTSAAEPSRAPTTIELGCANPDAPGKLPNALAGDPPLRQVVTRTLEAGVRGDSGNALNWSATAFRTDNRDDLLFVADNQSGFGYFRNFGKRGVRASSLKPTRRLVARPSASRTRCLTPAFNRPKSLAAARTVRTIPRSEASPVSTARSAFSTAIAFR